MSFKETISFLTLAGLLMPHLCLCIPIDTLTSDGETIVNTDILDTNRDPRQLSIFTPLRRAASTTREVVKFIRDYGMARYYNTTTPAPQTNVGKRATSLLQHVTINNIRDVVSTLLQSEAAPVVATFLKNIDRDTFQLFTAPGRTPPSIIARYTTSTLKPTTGKTNATQTGTGKPGESPSKTKYSAAGNKKPTKAPAPVTESTTKKVTVATEQKKPTVSGNSKNSGSSPVKNEAPVVNNVDEEDDSNEDD